MPKITYRRQKIRVSADGTTSKTYIEETHNWPYGAIADFRMRWPHLFVKVESDDGVVLKRPERNQARRTYQTRKAAIPGFDIGGHINRQLGSA